VPSSPAPCPALLRRLVASTTVALLSAAGLTITVPSASASVADPGSITAWGLSSNGQTAVPASLQDKDVIEVSAGYLHSLALTSDGAVTAWGDNGYGQNDIPASLTGKTVTAIDAGWYSDLALTSDGKITAWGSNDFGQLDIPASLADKTITAISVSEVSSMALTDDGKVTVWGENWYGQLNVPASLADKTVTAIATGEVNNMVLTSDGKVTVWGYAGLGQNNIPSSLSDKTVTAIDAGGFSSIALTSDGKVTVWGNTGSGQNNIPGILADKTVIAVAGGDYHSLALTDEGTVVAWGTNNYGESVVPAGLARVTRISAGYWFNLAVVGGNVAEDSAFTTGASATITGTPQVGAPLTADGGVPEPVADSLSYQWFADDVAIADATDSTFTPTAAELGAQITVEVTALKTGYTSSIDLSAPTDEVAAGGIDVSGALTLAGTGEVGETLTATSTVVTSPTATLAGQWLRDGAAIDGATDPTYELTNDDAGATITYQVTATATGYADAEVTSDGVGPVGGGVITLPAPVVTGTPVVDGTLTASLDDSGALDPADAAVSYAWTRNGTDVGTGSTYTPTADDAGEQLTVTATAAKAHFDDATSSTDTGEVAKADFTTGPTATITGTLKVGQTLTAGTGAVAPTAESFDYQWYADDEPVTGADESTFTLTSTQKHSSMSVEVTASRPGYTSLSDSSASTDAIATNLAPGLELTVDKRALRRGQDARLTWSSDEAGSLAASGGWAGPRSRTGTAGIRPVALGVTTYALSATNDNGTTTALVNVQVRRQAKVLRVAASDGLRLRGRLVGVAASGLDAREPYVIRIGGTTVATGRAADSGRAERTVRIPTQTREGNAAVTVKGSESDRTGRDTVRVVRHKKLGMRLAKQEVRASDDQTVTVTGLAAGERVTMTYQGERISPRNARANARGTYTRTFDVDIYWGTKSVKASGQYSGRRVSQTFDVVRRCRVGHVCD
jgi:Regulator of chromosome condensation (RCC1) repeat